MTAMTEAVLYIRVSSDKQSGVVSLDAQLAQFRQYAERAGMVRGRE